MLFLSSKQKSWQHRWTLVENPREVVPEVFAKILRVSMLSRKIARRGPPFLGFILLLLTSVLKFASGGGEGGGGTVVIFSKIGAKRAFQKIIYFLSIIITTNLV